MMALTHIKRNSLGTRQAHVMIIAGSRKGTQTAIRQTLPSGWQYLTGPDEHGNEHHQQSITNIKRIG